MYRTIFFAALLTAFSESIGAQETSCDSLSADSLTTVSDTVVRRKKGLVPWVINYLRNSNKESDKPFDCSVVFGPFYDATSSFSLGGGISALYKWDRNDIELKKSSLSIMAKVSIKGMLSLDVNGKNYMKHDRYRWNYLLETSNTPMDFWGIGYDNGISDEHKGHYKQFSIRFKPDFLFRLCPNLYVGPMAHIRYSHTYDFSNEEQIGGQSKDIAATGVGAMLNYDSRDFSLNAYRGQLLRVEQLFYPKFMNKYYFNATDITFCTYHGLWKKAVLAIEYHSLFNFGDHVPWTMLALVAEDSGRMRGYYEGRYRDRNIIEAQVEIRQRLPKRLGLVVFAGAANVFPEFDQIDMKHTLPNYGLGVRWEFKNRVNIRLDCGFTKNKPGVVFNINEAF